MKHAMVDRPKTKNWNVRKVWKTKMIKLIMKKKNKKKMKLLVLSRMLNKL